MFRHFPPEQGPSSSADLSTGLASIKHQAHDTRPKSEKLLPPEAAEGVDYRLGSSTVDEFGTNDHNKPLIAKQNSKSDNFEGKTRSILTVLKSTLNHRAQSTPSKTTLN
jgi:hypothetical protein